MPENYDYPDFSITFPAEWVAQVEINRPKKLNAFSPDMFHNLGAIFNKISTDPDIRAVVLTASGDRAFTAGLDVQTASETGPTLQKGLDVARKATLLRRHMDDYQKCVTAIEKCEKPVIAVLHGIAFGLAIDMTSACDVRYCTKDVRLSVREVEIGLAADVGTLSRLPHLGLPMSWVKDVSMTARDFGGEEALKVGYVSGLYDDKQSAKNAAMELAKMMATKSPVAVQSTKALINFSRDHSVQDGLDYTSAWNAAMVQAQDVSDAMLAGLKKTKPKFAKL